MAENEIEITLKWENNVGFEMTSKKNQNPKIVVIKTDENNHLADTFPAIAHACKLFFEKTIKTIETEMKQ